MKFLYFISNRNDSNSIIKKKKRNDSISKITPSVVKKHHRKKEIIRFHFHLPKQAWTQHCSSYKD